MHPKVWEASGHVSSFSDPLIDCKNCKTRHRADNLIDDFSEDADADAMSQDEMMEYIKTHHVPCPKCGKSDFTDIRQFNLMFETHRGVVEDGKNKVYLRPENAQGEYVNFLNVQRTTRSKLPFSIGQIGKAFRNEITPGNFIFRVREFEQMELEFFCKPDSDLEWFGFYKSYCNSFLKDLGIKPENLRNRDHEKQELSFYSKATTDIEYHYPFGWGELWGIADRTDYDLSTHMEHSKKDLRYIDPETNERYLPYVIEPSVGVERLFLAVLCDAYERQALENGTEREVLHLIPALAPFKATILPLVKKVHSQKANEIYSDLLRDFYVSYDDAGSIGKRYRRCDAIGVPFCITVDDETINDNIVTVRNRDTMTQEKVKVSDLKEYIKNAVKF